MSTDETPTAEKVVLSDAERLLGEWQRGEIPVDAVLTYFADRVAEAVERERAAWATKIEALASNWEARAPKLVDGPMEPLWAVPIRDAYLSLRALLTAADTEALADRDVRVREDVARETEAELVCGCEGEDRHGGGICYWGAAAARIARGGTR